MIDVTDVPDGIKALLREVASSWGLWDVKHRRLALRQLIDKVVMSGDYVRFVWSFL